MSYVETNLIPGESVLYSTGLHWITLIASGIAGVFLGFSGLGLLILAVAAIGDKTSSPEGFLGIGFLLLIMSAVCILVGYFQWRATEMAVTNKRVIIKTGLISRRTVEMLLSKIEGIGVQEGMVGRMSGYGTVVVRGTGGTPEPFAKVNHPLEFRRQVQQQVENSEQVGLTPHIVKSE